MDNIYGPRDLMCYPLNLSRVVILTRKQKQITRINHKAYARGKDPLRIHLLVDSGVYGYL